MQNLTPPCSVLFKSYPKVLICDCLTIYIKKKKFEDGLSYYCKKCRGLPYCMFNGAFFIMLRIFIFNKISNAIKTGIQLISLAVFTLWSTKKDRSMAR